MRPRKLIAQGLMCLIDRRDIPVKDAVTIYCQTCKFEDKCCAVEGGRANCLTKSAEGWVKVESADWAWLKEWRTNRAARLAQKAAS